MGGGTTVNDLPRFLAHSLNALFPPFLRRRLFAFLRPSLLSQFVHAKKFGIMVIAKSLSISHSRHCLLDSSQIQATSPLGKQARGERELCRLQCDLISENEAIALKEFVVFRVFALHKGRLFVLTQSKKAFSSSLIPEELRRTKINLTVRLMHSVKKMYDHVHVIKNCSFCLLSGQFKTSLTHFPAWPFNDDFARRKIKYSSSFFFYFLAFTDAISPRSSRYFL